MLDGITLGYRVVPMVELSRRRFCVLFGASLVGGTGVAVSACSGADESGFGVGAGEVELVGAPLTGVSVQVRRDPG